MDVSEGSETVVSFQSTRDARTPYRQEQKFPLFESLCRLLEFKLKQVWLYALRTSRCSGDLHGTYAKEEIRRYSLACGTQCSSIVRLGTPEHVSR